MAALAAATSACASSLPAPRPYPGAPAVRAIEIRGARQLGPDEIRAHLATAVTGRWPWSRARAFDPVVWEHDLLRIGRLYQAEGFYDAEVTASAVEPRRDGVVLRATVREGEPTNLAELRVEGLDGLPPAVRRGARDRIRLREGARFRQADWEETKSGILAALHDAGFAGAAAAGTVRVARREHVARALLEVTPGERYRFGPVRLATPAPPGVPADAILAEARAALDQSAWYDPAALAAAQLRVYRMGAFGAVSVSAAPLDPATGEVPVVVAVRSAPAASARAGAGATISPARDDVHASAELIDRHLGGLRLLRLRGRAGWAWVPETLTRLSSRTAARDGPLALGSLEADQPRFLGVTGLHLYGATEAELGVAEAYRIAVVRPRAGVSFGLGGTSAELSYGLDAARLLETPLVGDPSVPQAYGCGARCTLSFLQLRAGWSSRGEGSASVGERRIELLVRGGGGPLGGAHDLVQGVLDARATHPLDRGGRSVATARVSAGAVFPLGGEPVAPVLWRVAGGGEAMRGFSQGHLSPMLVVSRAGGAAVIATGGAALLEGGLEVARPVTGSISLAGFADAGAVSVERFDPGRLLGRLLYAVGAGLRWATPLGPLRVDLAYRLPLGPALPLAAAPGASPGTVRPSSCFGLFRGPPGAGAPEPPCLVHISFGEPP